MGHVDYFDRYFSFGVSAEDIADSTVSRAIASLLDGQSSPALTELGAKMLSDTARVCRKIKTEHDQGRVPARVLLVFLAGFYGKVPGTNDVFFDPRRTVQYLASDLLPHVTASEGRDLLRIMAQDADGLALMATVVARADHGTSTEDGKKSIEWLDQANQEAASLIRAFFDDFEDGVEALSEELWRTIWAWRWIDPDGLRDWLQSAAVSKNGWSTEEVLARCVQPARMDGIGFPPLEVTEIEPLLGVDFALEHVPPLEISERLEPSSGLQPSWGTRMRIARTLLDKERERRAQTEAMDGEQSIRTADDPPEV